MKKILSLLLLFSINSFGQGVNFEKGLNSDYNQSIAGITLFEEFNYLAENISRSNSFNSDGYLSKIDTLGNEVWRVEVLANSGYEVTKVNAILATDQGGVLVNGVGTQGCDFGGYYAFTEEYDINGLVVWSEIHSENNSSYGDLSCLYKKDSTLTFSVFSSSQSSKIYFHSIIGLDSLELTLTSVLGVNQATDSTVLLRTLDSLFEYDFQGNLLNSRTFGHDITGLDKITNDSIVVLTSDSLFVLNSNFQNLFSSTYTNYGNYKDLKIINGAIHFTASTPQIRWLISLDNVFQTEVIKAIPYSGDFNEVKLDYSSSHLSLATNVSLTNYKSIRFIDYSLNRNTNLFINDIDVSVIDVRINETSTLENSLSDSVYSVNLNVDVLVKNRSNTLVSECRISSYLGNSICNERYFTELKTGLSIGANDSIWIPLGWIGQGDYSLFQTPISYIKCFYTSNPNGIVDLNVSNDSYCKSGIAGYVSQEENQVSLISIYPNPVQNFLYLKSEDSFEGGFIYSINGELVMNFLNEKAIDISGLESGIYFVKVRTEFGVFNKRFFKSN